MSEETEARTGEADHEEIKEETHEFQDAEQDEVEGDEEGNVVEDE
jgi:hypothetical protein